MRRGREWAAVTVATMLALAGCAGESEDPPTTPDATSPVASPSATSTSTPTPDAATPPERPDMSQVNAATAEAVAVYFVELYPYVFATGDLTDWTALSHPECVYCADVGSGVAALTAEELSDSGVVEILDVSSSETTPGTWWLVQIAMRQGTTSGGDGVIYDTAVIVVREGDGWLIRGVEPRRRA